MTSISRYICKCTINYMGNNCEKNIPVTSHRIVFSLVEDPINWNHNGKIHPSLIVSNLPNPDQRVHTPKIPFPPKHMVPRPPSTSRLSNINHNPVRRIFPRTWIWEEVHMRFEH